jgi:hypothetical protein
MVLSRMFYLCIHAGTPTAEDEAIETGGRAHLSKLSWCRAAELQGAGAPTVTKARDQVSEPSQRRLAHYGTDKTSTIGAICVFRGVSFCVRRVKAYLRLLAMRAHVPNTL